MKIRTVSVTGTLRLGGGELWVEAEEGRSGRSLLERERVARPPPTSRAGCVRHPSDRMRAFARRIFWTLRPWQTANGLYRAALRFNKHIKNNVWLSVFFKLVLMHMKLGGMRWSDFLCLVHVCWATMVVALKYKFIQRCHLCCITVKTKKHRKCFFII